MQLRAGILVGLRLAVYRYLMIDAQIVKEIHEFCDTTRLLYKWSVHHCLLVWRDRVGRLATDPVVMRSSPAMGHNYTLCLINPNKLNLLSW